MRSFLISTLTPLCLLISTAAIAEDDYPQSNTAIANMQVQINQLHEEIRNLRGQLEQAQYQSRITADSLKKYETDSDYRLQAIEQKQAAAAAAPPPAPAPAPAASGHSASGFSPDAPGAEEVEEPATYQKAKPGEAAASPTGKDFPDANAHYNYAFKLLNEKKYPEAAASFDAFVKKYPADPLTANAYYWLGESYYARGDHTRASDAFRKGYEAAPDGQKAADNLLKLGLSLAQVKRVKEACIILQQVATKYAQTNARTATRADTERANLQCK